MNIYPIISENYEEGCGFLMGHYFITSAHVIATSKNPYIRIHGKKVSLMNSVFYEYSRLDPQGYDLAVFYIPEFYGELELYEGTITSGLTLTSQSFRKLGEEYIECEVTVSDFKEGNYFGGLSSINLKAGCSGSPVTIGNKKVVGVMTAGNNDNHDMPLDPKLPVNFCVFLSSSSIKRVLCENTNQL